MSRAASRGAQEKRRPILHVHAGADERDRAWLDDDELDAIPTVTKRDDAEGLTRTAKAVYRERRDGRRADGSLDGRKFARSFKARSTIAKTLEVDSDTVWRADGELEQKGYLAADPVQQGRTKIYELRRGSSPHGPHDAVESPHDAVRRFPSERAALTGGEARSDDRTASEPSPAEAGSAAVRDEPESREGLGRVPRGGRDPLERGRSSSDCRREPEDVAWLERAPAPDRLDVAEYRAAVEWLDRVTNRIDGARPTLEMLAAGACDDCRHEFPQLERLGSCILCRGCVSRRLGVGMRVATDAVTFGEREMPMPRRVVLPAGVSA